MNFWMFKMTWVFVVFFLWSATFTLSERVALGAAFLVLIGVIGEYVAEIDAVEKRELLRNGIKRLSMAILVVGLSGDVLGIIVGQAEMEELTKQAGNAATSAHNAMTDAGEAKRKSDAADKTAGIAQKEADAAIIASGTAQGEADAVETKADELDRQLAATQTQFEASEEKRIELEKSLAPRTFPFVPVNKLPKFEGIHQYAGTKIVLHFLPDAEAERAASVLMGALKAAGWDMTKAVPDPAKYTPSFDGVLVTPWEPSPEDLRNLPDFGDTRRLPKIREILGKSSQSAKIANELADFLIANGWKASIGGFLDEPFPPDSIGVIVGFKPNPYFDSNEIKQINAANEKRRQYWLNEERRMEDEERRMEDEERHLDKILPRKQP